MSPYEIHIIYDSNKDRPIVQAFDFTLKSVYDLYGVSFITRVFDMSKDGDREKVKTLYTNNRPFGQTEMLLVKKIQGNKLAVVRNIPGNAYLKLDGIDYFHEGALNPAYEAQKEIVNAFFLEETLKMLDGYGLLGYEVINKKINIWIWGVLALLVTILLWKIL